VHRVDVDLQVGIAENMPYEDDYFDIIFSNLVLHHCDIEKALEEVHRVAKSGCHLLVREPYMHSLLQKFRASRFIEKVIYPNLVESFR
jgi:ubiquinone/menaquinone biosynthesis C-methylase UbiE